MSNVKMRPYMTTRPSSLMTSIETRHQATGSAARIVLRTLTLDHIHIPRFVRCVARGDKDLVGARRKKDPAPPIAHLPPPFEASPSKDHDDLPELTVALQIAVHLHHVVELECPIDDRLQGPTRQALEDIFNRDLPTGVVEGY
jgi:hypothetical protein